MGLTVRIEPVEKSVEASIRADLDPATQKMEAAAFARKGIEEANATNRQILGRDIAPTITVDGVPGAPLETVNPDGGTIIAEWELMVGVIEWIANALLERSPVISGAYRRGHTLFVDGDEVPIGEEIPLGDEYAFTNFVPYSRKIEIGKTKAGRAFVIQVENKIYERTAKDARARFGNQAEIFFTYRGIVGGRQINQLTGPVTRSRNRKGRFLSTGGARAHNKSENRWPTVYVRHRRD
jgi:hypothetical protein